MPHVISPKEPKNKTHWKDRGIHQTPTGPVNFWKKTNGVLVGSAVEAPEPDKIGPEYHVSISKNGARVSEAEALVIISEFQMIGPDEDNHINGISRHFWEPVREDLKGYVCPCKRTEKAIIQGDYTFRPEPAKE